MSIKISALPAGTSPTGTEVIPLVQAGQTKTVTPAQLAAYANGLLPSVPPALGTDSGAANAYILTTSPSIPVPSVGQLCLFTPSAVNTGPSTANFNGAGADAILNQFGNALTGGELNVPTWIQWTGAAWHIVGTGPLPDKARTAAEIAAGVTPTNYAYPPVDGYGGGDLRRYGQNGTATPDTTALTSALAVLNGSGFLTIPVNYAGSNPSSLPAGVTVLDFRVGTTFPPESTVFLGGGRWINFGGSPKGAYTGLSSSQFVTSPSETTSSVLGTNMVSGNLTAGGGSISSGTFEVQTTGALTGIGGNTVNAVTGQVSIESTGQTLPLVVGIEGGGGIDRTAATTNITTWVSVEGDPVVNASTSGATITNAFGGRFIQSTASGITNNNCAIASYGDLMFSVGSKIRVENGSALSTVAFTFPNNTSVVCNQPLGLNGNAAPAQVTGFGTPTGTGVINNFPGASATLAQCSQAIAQLIKDLKALGVYGA